MRSEIHLGKINGLHLTAAPSAIAGYLLLWLVFAATGLYLVHLPVSTAGWFGLLASLGHWFSEIWHQLGHAWFARRAGYPMEGIRLSGLLGTSLYPADEPALPAAIHIRRALGGPLASFMLTILLGILILLLRNAGGLALALAGVLAVENLLVFTLGAFLPLGFTDGSTLLTWWRK